MSYKEKTREQLVTELQELLQVNDSLKELTEKQKAILHVANKKYDLLKKEKEERAALLNRANKELREKNKEIKEREAEWIITKKKLNDLIHEHKQADGILTDFVDKNPMSIQIIDKDGYTFKVNPAYNLLFGALPPADFSIFDDPQLKQQALEVYFDRLINGEVIQFPDTYFNAHDLNSSFPDALVWIRAIGFPLNNSKGKSKLFVIMHENITERIKVAKLMQDSEEKHRALTENINDAIILINENAELVYQSPSADRLLGYMLEDTKNKKVFEFVHPDDLELTLTHFQQSYSSPGVPVMNNFRVQHKAGHYLWIEGSIINLLDNESIKGFIFNFRDISERKQAEVALKNSRKLLSETEKIGKVGGWEFNIDTMEQIWTDEVYKIHEVDFNYNPNVKKGIDFYSPESRPIIQQAVQRVIEFGEPFDLELEIITAKGNLRNVHAIGKADIEHRKVYGSFQDITERKQAEKELTLLSARQEAILDAVPDILMEVDNNKIYTWANKEGYNFFGDDVIGKEAKFYFVGEQETYNTVQSLFNGSKDIVYVESWQLRKDGEKRLLAWNCRSLKDAQGNVYGTLSSGHDITERKQAETEIQKRIDELELFHTLTVGREIKMNELEKEINQLLIKAGREPKY